MCAVAFYYVSVLRVDYRRTALLNLKPGPDATEYFAQAVALAKGERPTIRIGHEKLPSAFPPGYPALMVPWLAILPAKNAVLAPFRTNQAIGLFMLVAVFLFYLYLSMPIAGGVAALLLSTLPGFYTFCRSSLSDTSAWFLYALAFMFAYLGLKEERRSRIYVSAVLLGLSMNFRLQSAFYAPLLIAMLLMPVRNQFWRWFLHCAAVSAVFFLAASPYLILNTIEFGSPFRIGGSFWYPPRQLFSLANIPIGNIALFCTEFTMGPHRFLAADVFGTGTVFVPGFAILIGVGLFFIRVDRAFICLLVADLVFLGATAAYLYPDGRYYLQLLILLIPVAVLPVIWALKNIARPRKMVAACSVLTLFVASCLGYPSRSGATGNYTNRFQTWDALNFAKWSRNSLWFQAQKGFAAFYGRDPGLVLSDIDPVYLNALLSREFAAIPIDGQQLRQWSPVWHYRKSDAQQMVEHALQRPIPVYSLFISRKEAGANKGRLPHVDGYEWLETYADKGAVVLKLMPNQARGNFSGRQLDSLQGTGPIQCLDVP